MSESGLEALAILSTSENETLFVGHQNRIPAGTRLDIEFVPFKTHDPGTRGDEVFN